MSTQDAYAARLQAQMRVADARLDQLEAQARARNAQTEMDEVSGLRARRDKLRQQVEAAKKELSGDWDAVRGRVGSNWTDFRRDVTATHNRFTAWDTVRERRFIAHLDEAESALRGYTAKDAEAAADVRVEASEAHDELRDKVAAARQRLDAWRERQTDEARVKALDEMELELEEAANRYASAVEDVVKRPTGRRS